MVVDERLLKYIKAVKARGYSPDKVRKLLIERGWKPAVVDEAILTAGISIQSTNIPPYQPLKQADVAQRKNKTFLLLFVTFIFLIAVILIYLISSGMININLPGVQITPEQPSEPMLQNQFCKYSVPIECSEYQIAPQFMTLSFKNTLSEDIKINSVTVYVNEEKCITEREIPITANGEAQFLIDACSSDLITKFQSGFNADVAYSKGKDKKTVKLAYS